MKFFEELKRRNVIKATMAYVVVAWVLIQVFTNILPVFQAPPWVLKVLMILLAIGLPVWIVFSWVYDVTPEGLKRTDTGAADPTLTATTNKRLNVLILVVLVIAVILQLFDRSKSEPIPEKEVVTVSESNRENSIAVLPFLDMSPNKDQEYYSDGIAVDILNALCKYRTLKVVGRTSSFSFKGKDEDILSIGKKLKVNNILEGSVQKQNEQVKISIQLIDATNGYTLFSETYTDKVENIFDLQTRIAREIAEKIESEFALTQNEVHDRQQINPRAYEAFLRGKLQFVNGPLNMKRQEVLTAKRYFEAALKIEPDYAEASSYLSLIYFNLSDWAISGKEVKQRRVALDSANLLAKRAHELDSLSPGAHLAMGSYYFHDYDWLMAEKEKRRAVALNPGGADEKFILSSFLSQFGDPDEAIALSREALQLSPMDPAAELSYIHDLTLGKKFKEGIAACEKLIAENRMLEGAYLFLFMCHVGSKEYEKAGKAWSEWLQLQGQEDYARLFRENDFQTAVKTTLAQNEVQPLSFLDRSIYLASFNAYLQNRDETIRYLEEVYRKKDPQISWMRMPRFDFLRDDPKFQQLYEKAGFTAYDAHREK